MNESKRRALVEMPRGSFTLKGKVATVAGYKNELEASVTTYLPGFYRASWEEIKRASESGGVIINAYWYSGLWLGCKQAEGEQS